MTLTGTRPIDRFGSQNNVYNPNGKGGILAATKLQQGQAIGWTAAGLLAPIGNPSPNLVIKAAGVSDKLYDNSAGASNALTALYEVGVFPFNVGAGVDALTIANLFQQVFYIDDQSVGATDGLGTRLLAGILVDFDPYGHALVQGSPSTGMGADYFTQTWQKTAADGAAATATTEFPFIVAPFAGRVAKLVAAPGAAGLTANDTNFATVILSKRTAALPGTAVPVAQFTTQTTGQAQGTGTWTAWLGAYGPAAGILATFAQGDELTLQITKGGTGVVVPIMTLQVDLLSA